MRLGKTLSLTGRTFEPSSSFLSPGAAASYLHEVTLYEDLIRRAIEAKEQSASIAQDSARILGLARILRTARNGEVSIRRCAWCERYQIGEEWLHLNAIGTGQMLMTKDLLDRATHGICADCLAREKERSAKARVAHTD